MSFEKAKKYIEYYGLEDRILVFDVSSATVELAANAVGTQPEKIVKSLTFDIEGSPIMVLCAGDAKISNSKFKQFFNVKAKMLSKDNVNNLTGHEVGGVCPFGINKDVKVYLDISIKRFDIVYPACGSCNSAIKLSVQELEKISNYTEWIDVCQIITTN